MLPNQVVDFGTVTLYLFLFSDNFVPRQYVVS